MLEKIAHTQIDWRTPAGASNIGRNDALSVIEILGVGESVEILYNAMRRPVGLDQRAYSTGMLRLSLIHI